MKKKHQFIAKHYKLISFICLLISLGVNAGRVFLTIGYETRAVHGWQPLLFILFRVISLVCLIMMAVAITKSKDINKQKLPSFLTFVMFAADVAVWTITSGKMIVMALRYLTELAANMNIQIQ